MHRLIVVIPNLFAERDAESVCLQELPAIRSMAEQGRLFAIQPMPAVPTPEAAYLGLDPHELIVPPGVLTVAALGADPPDRSAQFHLSLAGVDAAGAYLDPGPPPAREDLQRLFDEAARLETSKLRLVRGPALDHALVWEGGSTDVFTVDASEMAAEKRPIVDNLPQGEGERVLRRFIDDSVNLLAPLELNRRREDEGLPPLNLLWPWGPGFRLPMPNLLLRRGEPGWVESGSTRLQGLSKLTQYRHGSTSVMGNGISVRFPELVDRTLSRDLNIVVLEGVSLARRHARIDEGAWLMRRVAENFLYEHLRRAEEQRVRVTLLGPTTAGAPDGTAPLGLGLTYDSGLVRQNGIPFDERALDDRRLTRTNLWETIESAVLAESEPWASSP